ncbi:MAG: hypothetical protein KC492_13125 [Myxococcales bacterium]|nr:hypothetical protein [Myxococcales bacterium]
MPFNHLSTGFARLGAAHVVPDHRKLSTGDAQGPIAPGWWICGAGSSEAPT